MIGRRLSHYDVTESLGAGGMGEVYRAHDTRLNRDVAIKVLPADRSLSDNARRRFQREAMAASALNHPNIITIYEINSQDTTDFIVMEYVRGVTLASVLRKRSLGVEEAVRYAIQIADAVAKAHAAGIIHRDLKPGNVMVTEDGLVKVLDFGLAKFHEQGTAPNADSDSDVTKQFTLTQPGMITGTVAYMSPEQARGEPVDARSDIFSFGTVLFEMLSGHLPFTGQNSIALLHNLHFSPPRDLNQLRPGLPGNLVALISRMLEKEPEKRIQTMTEVASALRRGATGSVTGPLTWRPTDATLEVATTPVARGGFNRRLWAAAGLLVVLAVASGLGWYFIKRPITPVTIALPEAPVEDNAYALYQRAREYLDHSDREGNLDRAIKLLERAVQLDPKSAAAYAALGEAYYSKNSTNPDPQWMKLASDYANRAVELDNYLATGHISLGLVMMRSGKLTEAERQFRMAIDLDPKNSMAHRNLGVLYDRTGKSEQAAQELRLALQLNPNDWKNHLVQGLHAYQLANYKEAASSWEQALKLEPESVQTLLNLGAVYHALGRDDDAATVLQRALAIRPAADVYNNLGTIRFYQGHYDDSVLAFEKTVELNANAFDSWGNLGDAYRWSSGQKEKAKATYQRAIQLVREEIAKHPDQIELRANLAMYLAKSGDTESALKELQPVDHAQTREPPILYNSAIVYELCGQRGKALELLLAAVKAGQPLADVKNEPEFVSLRADPRYHLKILSAADTKPSR